MDLQELWILNPHNYINEFPLFVGVKTWLKKQKSLWKLLSKLKKYFIKFFTPIVKFTQEIKQVNLLFEKLNK